MAALMRLPKGVFRSIIASQNSGRFISTSKKNRDTIATTTCETSAQKTSVVDKKNWVSYGFETKNEKDDLNVMHNVFFFSISVCIVFGGFILSYAPDPFLRDWSQREAFLELRRRESLGLPLIDRNLIDPNTIELPTDEELGDTEIII